MRVLQGALAFVRRRPIAVGSAAVLTVLCIQVLTKRSADWIPVYVGAARKLLAGEDIYQGVGYAYPPFMAMFAILFTPLPPLAIRFLFFAICAVCAVVMVRSAWRIAGGDRLDDPAPWSGQTWAIFLFGLLCGGPYILNTFGVQQTDLLIGALLIGGCFQLLNGRQIAGGALIGLAAACKMTPLLFAPYLYLRRQWLAGTMVLAVGLGVNLLPDLISAPPKGGLWMTQWVSGSVLRTEQNYGAVQRMTQWGNLSLNGLAFRATNSDMEFRSGTLEMVERPGVSHRMVFTIYLSLAAVVGLISLAALWGMPQGMPRTAVPGGLPPPTAVEYAMVVCLMLLLSPMSSSAHFNILVLPGFCVARLAFESRDRMIWVAMSIAGALFLLTNKDLVRDTVYTVLTWSGSTTLGTLLLWWACVWALLQIYRRGALAPAAA